MFKGSIVALVTPFTQEGKVDFEKLETLINWHIDNDTDGIVVFGTTGESPTLTIDEEKEIVACAVKTSNGRIPIIAGSGSNSTQEALHRSLLFEGMGVDGLLLITPYYNKTNEEGMKQHFLTVADKVNIPIILYNVPSRTGCQISIPVLKELSLHPNIVAIKEASGDISYVMEVSKLITDDFSLLSGNDDTIFPLLSVGGTGVISVWANIMPKEVHELVKTFEDGDIATSLQIQQNHLQLINTLFVETNPIPVKNAMNMLGFQVGPLRLPLADLSEANEKLLSEVLKSYREALEWK
ncbi:4-hydroxy-tetrahydrodipicolinate synthase [Vagococcus elongatus]|uniref:4-hydroxy-tetrahydrodipicolinate synthase n=1 Tax=Vagococcus elongatus TaxID=180344 RepID=A0A430AQB4_9ENTE|nr:4-hydroxy-tetrahydrodipicolinate synthase [Vagococcus elongatus]RSU10312.1 4-hydroxy-tetrahydrodipicolinate synthase [Vagococcus elongatus]